MYSVATDKLGAVWDVEVGQRIKKLKGHSSYVNSCSSGSVQGVQSVCTGSDDGTLRVCLYRKYLLFRQLQVNEKDLHENFSVLVFVVK